MKIKTISKRVLSILLTLLMLMSSMALGLTSASAANLELVETGATITSDGTARLYFNMSAVSWWVASSGNGNFAYFFNSTTNQWSAHSVNYSGNTYYVIIPSGSWTTVILTRNNTSTSPSWDNKWNQTGNITLSSTSNYISSFSQDSTSATWGTAVKPASTAKLSASTTTVTPGTAVTLTPSLSSNATINTIKSTSYSISPESGASMSGNTFTATTPGTYTVTATVTYYPNGYSSLTSTATATTTITVEASEHTVTFLDWDDTLLDKQTVQDGEAATAPTPGGREGYTFAGWDTDFSNVTEDLTVKAQYILNTYDISVDVLPSEGGSAYITYNGSNVGTSTTVNHGDSATVTASANEGYKFTGWTVNGEAQDGEETTLTLSGITADTTVVANFEETITYNVSVSASPAAGGEVQGGGNVADGSATTITAIPNAGYHFAGWTITSDEDVTTISGSENDQIFIFNPHADVTAVANFEPNTGTVNFGSNGNGVVTNGGGNAATYPNAVTSTATASTGYHFTSWTISSTGTEGTDYVFADNTNTLTENISIQIITDGTTVTATANFAINTYTVTFLDKDGNEIDSQQVEHGSAATAPTAPTVTGYTFSKWDKDFSNITADTTVNAVYNADTYTVTVVNPAVGGSATASTETVTYPATVTLTAIADTNYIFTGWDIDGTYTGDATGSTVTITPTSDLTVTPKFAQGQYLTVHTYSDNGYNKLAVNADSTVVLSETEQPNETEFNGVTWDTSAKMEIPVGSTSVTATLSGGSSSDTVIYVDFSAAGSNWGSGHYLSITASSNSTYTMSSSNTSGAGSYVPKNDTWLGSGTLVSGSTYMWTIPSANLSNLTNYGFTVWSSNESNYDNVWATDVSHVKYSTTYNTYTISSSKTTHNDRQADCFSLTASSNTVNKVDIDLTDTLFTNGSWNGVEEVWIYESDGSTTVTTRRALLDLLENDDIKSTYEAGNDDGRWTDDSWNLFVANYDVAYASSGKTSTLQAAIDSNVTNLTDAFNALTPQNYYTVNVSQNVAGTVVIGSATINATSGTATVIQNSTVTYTVTAPTNYYIVSVSVDGTVVAENKTPSYSSTFTASADAAINVVYSINPTVEVTENDVTGTVTVDGYTGTSQLVTYGATVKVTITAPENYYIAFVVDADGNLVPFDEDTTYTEVTVSGVTANKVIAVTYDELPQYTVSIGAYDDTQGTLYYNGEAIPAEGTVITVYYGDSVTITAQPADGFAISAWSGSASGVNDTITFSNIKENKTLNIAWAELKMFTVTAKPNNYDAGTATVNSSASVTIEENTQVTLKATVSDGCFEFSGWNISGSYTIVSGTVSSEEFVIIPKSDITATAGFTQTKKAIYLKNDAGWTTPIKVHYWGGEYGTTWPGDTMTYDSSLGAYVAYIAMGTTGVKFSQDGSDTTAKQFDDIGTKNWFNNSTGVTDTRVEAGYYLQGTWNGKNYSAYDLKRFTNNGDGTYSIEITVTSTTDGYIYVNPTDEASNYWLAASANATDNPQTLTASTYTTSPNQVKVEIDTTDYTKAYDVVFTFNPETGVFSWTKTEARTTVKVKGTDGMTTTSADTSGKDRVGNTYFDTNTVKSTTSHTYYEEAAVYTDTSTTFNTQVYENSTGGYDYYVAGWVVNGKEFVTATALGNGLYTGAYKFTESSDIVPIYFHTNDWLTANKVSTVTVYAVTDKGISGWDEYMAAYTWYKEDGTNKYEGFGLWGGQLLIPVTGLDGVYYTYVETTSKDGISISGISFNNYWNGNGNDVVISNSPQLQTYDYYEFVALNEDGQQNITFVVKDTNSTSNKDRVSTSSITISNFAFEQFTDYSGLKTDIFGNNIESIDDTLTDADALYIVQTGDNSENDGTLSGDHYVKSYLYNASGTYLGSYWSYELHDKDNAIWDTLASYENQRAYICYEAESGNRYDGEWYGDASVSVTINLAVNVGLSDDGGATYVINTADPVNISDTYGAGYVNATYQNVDVTRGTTVTLTATPKTGYKFVGWFTADCTLFSTNPTVAVTAAIGTTYTAVFDELTSGYFYVNHYIYQGTGTSEYQPAVHGGNALLYVGIENITTGASVSLTQTNTAYVEAVEGQTLRISIATDATGADKFYAWYTDAVDKYGYTTYEEVGVDSDDNLAYELNNGTVVGRNDKVYFTFDYVVGEDLSINLYSDIMSVSVNVTLVYMYADRNNNNKFYYVPYVLSADEIEGFEGNEFTQYTPAYITSPDGEWVNTILDNAPYIEDFNKDTTWIINSAMYDTMTFEFWATQPAKKFNVTVHIGESGLVVYNDAAFNTNMSIDVNTYLPNVRTGGGYWFKDNNGDGVFDKAVDVILSYNLYLGYVITEDADIYFVVEDGLEFAVGLDAPVYGREQTTTSDGTVTSDKVMVDYLVNIVVPYMYGHGDWKGKTPIYNGKEVTDQNWSGAHVTIESLVDEGYEVSFGMILEQVGSFEPGTESYPTFDDALAAAQAKGYGTATDAETLATDINTILANGKINGWDSNNAKYLYIYEATDTAVLSNVNRYLYCFDLTNNISYQKRFYNVYSYVTIAKDGESTTYISNVQTLNIYETGNSNANVDENTSYA